MKPTEVSIRVNGQEVGGFVEPRTTLATFVREVAGLTGTHLGCWHGVCGACSVLLDGELVRGCLSLAVQARGRAVTTVEGLGDAGALTELQQAFRESHAVQCGFCTPGMLVAATALLDADDNPSEAAIRDHLHGNLCRCTGYEQIIEAVQAAAAAREADQ
jgi:aerobic carbon-monoxide dehydrogenase small subunit